MQFQRCAGGDADEVRARMPRRETEADVRRMAVGNLHGPLAHEEQCGAFVGAGNTDRREQQDRHDGGEEQAQTRVRVQRLRRRCGQRITFKDGGFRP